MKRFEINKKNNTPALVVAISSRALFDLDQANQVFEAQGEAAYSRNPMPSIPPPHIDARCPSAFPLDARRALPELLLNSHSTIAVRETVVLRPADRYVTNLLNGNC